MEETELFVAQRAVSLSAARTMFQAGASLARERGLALVFAVVDPAGHLKAFERMDGAPLNSAEIAINKAWTAAAFGMTSQAVGELIAGDPQLAQLAHTPRLVAFGGGYSIVSEGHLMGGLGVSGGSYVEDMEVAETALCSLKLRSGRD